MRYTAEGELCSLNGSYTFSRFVRGEGNLLACAAAQAVAESPAKAYNPLFLHGKVGLGKTHLLHAIGNAIVEGAPWMKVIYITSERFTIELVNAIRENRTEAFRKRFRGVDALLIDDVHFLKDRDWTQEELFHTFNELYEDEKQIVLSSDRPPEELSQLQDRLVSRFRWGLVAEIQPPDLETRLAILRAKSRESKLQLDDELLLRIARRVRSSVRALEGALIKVAAHLELYPKDYSAGALELDELLPVEPAPAADALDIEQIKAEVARRYEVSVEDLEGDSRAKPVSQARHVAIYLARELTRSSFPAIGRAFGNRNHSTIMHSYRKAKALLQTPLFRHELDELKGALAARFNDNDRDLDNPR